MPPQSIASWETFTANLADIRLVTGMHPTVSLQIMLPAKGTWADTASKRFELRMGSKMGFEVVGTVLGKGLVAVGIGACGNTVEVDACVHGVAEGVDHVGCV